MSYLDPYGGTGPRGWDRQGDPPDGAWPGGEDDQPRARHPGAAPEAYLDQPDADDPYRSGQRDGGTDRPSWADGPTRATGQLDPAPFVDAGGVAVGDAAADAAGKPPPGRHRGRRRAGRDGKPVKPGRAGRNLPAAIAVGLGLGALIVVPLVLYRPAFLAVIAAAVAVGVWEMTRAVRRAEAHPPLVPLVVGGLLMVGLAWFSGPDALSLGLLVTVLAAVVWRLGDGPAGFQRDMTAAALIAVYVPFLGGFAALLAAPADGHLRVLATLVAVVLSDTGGYVAGVWLGRHPMAPTVSPKKSWEGFGGSVTAAAIGSAALLWFLLDVLPWWGAVFGVAVSVAAVLGDLGESMIKRDLGIKDMSNLLPGHGGLMDRLDSVLFAVPVGYLLLAIFAPTG